MALMMLARSNKNFDSLEPILTCDPNHLPTEKVAFNQSSSATVEVVSADPRLEARMVGKSILTLLAYVDDEGPFDAFIALKVDGNFLTAGLHKGMDREDMIDELNRCLPMGYEAAARDGSMSEVLIVNILRPQLQSADPEIHFLSTDVAQQFRWMGRNKLRIEGRASYGMSIRSHLELFIEGYRVRLPLAGGDFPITTAKRLREALPKHLSALIELPIFAGGDVTLTILRRR